MIPTDILLDDNNNIIIENGDFKIGDSTRQHQKHLLIANPGDIKDKQLVGVGIFTQLDDESPDDLIRDIRTQYVRDGMTVDNLSVGSDGKINVDAKY